MCAYWNWADEEASRGEVEMLGGRMLLLLLALNSPHRTEALPGAVRYTSLATGSRFQAAGAMIAAAGRALDVQRVNVRGRRRRGFG